MTILAAGIAFVFSVISVVGVLVHEKDIANEAKLLHFNKLKNKNNKLN
jgi:hypothetical protein